MLHESVQLRVKWPRAVLTSVVPANASNPGRQPRGEKSRERRKTPLYYCEDLGWDAMASAANSASRAQGEETMHGGSVFRYSAVS